MDEFENDLNLVETPNTLECQVAFQNQLDKGATVQEPGWFEFTLSPYVDCISESMGVLECLFTAILHQQGQFIEDQRLSRALSNAIYHKLKNLILCENIPWRDYLYFNWASNCLNHAYGYRRYTLRNGWLVAIVWIAFYNKCQVPSILMKTLKWLTPFNCCLLKCVPHPEEAGREKWNQGITTRKPLRGSKKG